MKPTNRQRSRKASKRHIALGFSLALTFGLAACAAELDEPLAERPVIEHSNKLQNTSEDILPSHPIKAIDSDGSGIVETRITPAPVPPTGRPPAPDEDAYTAQHRQQRSPAPSDTQEVRDDR